MAIHPGNREETVETIELRTVLSEYDQLEDEAAHRSLTPEEQHAYDDLYSALLLEEEEHWEGASALAVETLRDITGLDFPMIRYTLGLLDHQFNN